MVSGITSSPDAASLQSVMLTSPSMVVHVSQQSTISIHKVNPFQSLPISPKDVVSSVGTVAKAPSGIPENASAPTVGAVPRKEMTARLLQEAAEARTSIKAVAELVEEEGQEVRA